MQPRRLRIRTLSDVVALLDAEDGRADQPLSSGDKPAGDPCGPRPSPRLTRSPTVAGMTSQATLCDLFAATAVERHGDLALRAGDRATSWPPMAHVAERLCTHFANEIENLYGGG